MYRKTDKEIRRLIHELNDPSFRLRQRAIAELTKHGELTRLAIRAVYLDLNSATDLRKQLDAVYDKIGQGPTGEWLQAIRGAQVLGAINSKEARVILKELASKPADDRIADEARAILQRLEKKQSE